MDSRVTTNFTMNDKQEEAFFILRGMKNSTTATKINFFEKGPEKVMEVAEQLQPVQSPTNFKRDAVIELR